MNWARAFYEAYRSKEGVVDICGVIIYTDAHANVKKVLMDEVYWKALDEISGPRWAVLAVKPVPGKYEYPQMPEGNLGFMVPIWKEPRENRSLLEEFCIKSTEQLPLFICFSHDGAGQILMNSLKLDDSSIDASYASMKNHIKMTTEAIENIAEENKKDAAGVYGAVSAQIDNFKGWERIKAGVKFIDWIKKLIKFV